MAQNNNMNIVTVNEVEEKLSKIVIEGVNLLDYLREHLPVETINNFDVMRSYDENNSVDIWIGYTDSEGYEHGEEVNLSYGAVAENLEFGMPTPDEDEEDYWDEFPKVLFEIGDSADVIKPIVKSIWRAYKKGVIDLHHFGGMPRFNHDSKYELTVMIDEEGWLTMYVHPISPVVKDEDTGEYCYEGKTLHAYYSPLDGTGTFHFGGWYSRPYKIPYKVWESLVIDIINKPDNYRLSKSSNPIHTEGEYLKYRLNEMPFDRFENGKGFIHATGWEFLDEDGEWYIEYEDDFE